MKKFLLLLLSLCACGTTINASNYASDCDAASFCVPIVVGNICSCSCDLAAINDRDYDKYISDVERIGVCENSCIGDSLDASFTCGAGIGARCVAGTCATYTLPIADSGAEQ